MGRKSNDLTNKKFGKLTALERVDSKETKDKHAYWRCSCECGNFKNVSSAKLVSGSTISCGCSKHRKSNTKLHAIWSGIKKRCLCKTQTVYENYGGRGIELCEEWNDFINFYNWAIENGYEEDLTIDRIDVNGNYEPSNCRWVDKKVQANNTRRNHFITFLGRTQTISQWQKKQG